MDFLFERHFDLNVSEMREILQNTNLARVVPHFIYSLPLSDLDARVRLLYATINEVELRLPPDFRYNRFFHGAVESFWIIIEYANSEHLLSSHLRKYRYQYLEISYSFACHCLYNKPTSIIHSKHQ